MYLKIFISFTLSTFSLFAMENAIFSLLASEDAANKQYLDKLVEHAITQGFYKAYQTTGETFLHVAVKHDLPHHVPALIKQYGASPKDNASITPLHIAAYHNNEAMVNMLVDAGADVSIQNNFGRTPLHDAINKGSDDIVQKILSKKPNLSLKDQAGITPLFAAVNQNRADVAQALLAAGADPNQAANSFTPLHHAAYTAQLLTVKALLQKGANPNAQNMFGKTALHDVADASNSAEGAQIAQLLLDAHADVSLKNNQGETPLDLALKKGNANIADVLLRDRNGQPKASAAMEEKLISAAWQTNIATVKKLIKKAHVDVNAQDHMGKTALHEALAAYFSPFHSAEEKERARHIIQTLCKHGARVDKPNNYGKTPREIDRNGLLEEINTALAFKSLPRQ